MKGVFSAFKPWRTTALFCWEGRPIFAARLCRSPIRTTNLRSRKPRQGPRYLLPTDAHFERLIVGDFLFGLVNISSMFFNPFQSLHIHMKANSHNLFRLTTSHVSKRINFSGKKKKEKLVPRSTLSKPRIHKRIAFRAFAQPPERGRAKQHEQTNRCRLLLLHRSQGHIVPQFQLQTQITSSLLQLLCKTAKGGQRGEK